MKKVTFEKAIESKFPEWVVLAICIGKKDAKPNIIPLGWSMCTSFEPPMFAISVGHKRYSHKLISESKEFVLCFPSEKQKDDVLFCGSCSGKNLDKFAHTSFKKIKAKFVKAPLIEDCVSCFECIVVGQLCTGDHTIFVGQVQASYISEKYQEHLFNFGERNLKIIKRK